MTDHVKDQLCARIEELEAEKMELNEQLDVAHRERDEAARDLAMEQEHHQATRRSEEALAAHVEFCHKVLSMIENGPDYLVAKQYRAIRLARERKPETSLARLKAQWQAEVLESCENMAETSFIPCLGREQQVVLMDGILKVAAELRRQAEGGEA